MEPGGFSASMDIGMIVVGLVILLFIIFLFIRNTTKNKDLKADSGTVTASDKGNMNEIAAAIGTALHIYISRNAARAITIKRTMPSAWKEVQRERFMQRL